MNIPRIYVAAPYTSPSLPGRLLNRDNAVRAGECVMRAGGYPVVPHISGLTFEHINNNWEWWMDVTSRELSTCDAVLMGFNWENSRGSKIEYEQAVGRSMPIFYYRKSDFGHRRWDAIGVKLWISQVWNA